MPRITYALRRPPRRRLAHSRRRLERLLEQPTEGGCGCASDPRPASGGLVALLGLLALRPRRRARA
jgi:MYXO-CTERM domain-containing protein